MMQVRCQNCAWLFTLNKEAIGRAVAIAQAKQEEFHIINCPQCSRPIRLDAARMRQLLPDDYILPEVKLPSPEPAPAAVAPPTVKASSLSAPPPSATSELTTNIAFIPQWDPKKKREITQFLYRLIIIVVAAGWIFTVIWLFMQKIGEAPATALPPGADLALVLAPVLAAAAGIERFLETLFSIIEQNWLTLVAYLGRGLRWLHSAETEVQEARKWLADISQETNRILQEMPTAPEQIQAMIPDQLDQGKTINEWRVEMIANVQKQLDMANNMMQVAEKRLADAERELSQVVTSASYKNAKRAASIILGLWLGIIVATIGQLQMFAMLGVGNVPAKVDVLITGLVIGSGSYPVHSLVGLLQGAKDTLDSAQGYLKDKSAEIRKLTGK